MNNNNSSKRQIAILGSTGSIGTQALEVIDQQSEVLEVFALTANRNVELLIEQALRYRPAVVVVAHEPHYERLKEALADTETQVWAGAEALCDVVRYEEVDMVLTAMVGYAGLAPTMAALKAGKAIALSNKETLVVAGELITQLSQQYQAPLIPVDSEHSALFQCLVGEEAQSVERLILTASGGPFRNHTAEQLAQVTLEEALKHPNWDMGAKVTIDSATMMNKGFEMIEARWLFDIEPERIDVVVHPESIIHSMVQYRDSSIKAQMGLPDMRLPIQYALTFPERKAAPLERLDLARLGSLTFQAPDEARFPNLRLAYDAIAQGGNMPCILNAANEIAVDRFVHHAISYLGISRLIEQTMEKVAFVAHPSYEQLQQTDHEARQVALSLITNNKQ